MCVDPLTLTVIATTVAAVGQGVGALNQAAQGRYQARVAEQNAKLDSEAAFDARQRGKTEAANYQRQLSQQQGAQRAALAANGIDATFGSASMVQRDLATVGQADVSTIRENAARESRGLEMSALNYRAQAAASRQAASGALIEGAFGVGSTLLGGAQQYKRIQWNQRKNPTANPWG